MRVLVIGNPVSGGGRTGRLLTRIEECLERRGHRVEVRLTAAAGDARAFAGNIDPAVDRLLVVGGDGTLNEVVNGLRDPSLVPLAQLATGTANILAHELELPRRPEAVVHMLEHGRVRRIDLGSVGDRRFLMVVSAGFDAMVTKEILRSRSGTLGYRGYLLPILRVLWSYRRSSIEVTVDGAPPVQGELVIASNTSNYGGLFTMADRAICDSGHLDVCVLTRASLWALARAGIHGFVGGLSEVKGVEYVTGQEIRIRARESVPVEVDGDYLGSTPVDISLEPRKVPLVVP